MFGTIVGIKHDHEPLTELLTWSFFHIMENELLLVWQVVSELSEQLAINQKLAYNLQSQAGDLKVPLFPDL